MEENKKSNKFVCKYCKRSYPCGKSLGGHIRTHMNSAQGSVEEKEKAKIEKLQSLIGEKRVKRSSVCDAAADHGDSGYVLRENPKKTRRFSDLSSFTLQQGKFCKECGKGFQSLKALCGHMACHSEKEKRINNNNPFEENSGTNQRMELIMDSYSDTEASVSRSEKMRYKRLDFYSCLENGNSSSVSNIEQEEDVAMCLMMLSRDHSSCRGGLMNSLTEASDNNSVVLETKSSSTEMRSIRKGLNCVSETNGTLEVKKGKFKKTSDFSASKNTDYVDFRNRSGEVELDFLVNGFHKNNENKKLKVKFGSNLAERDAKLVSGINKMNCADSEFVKKSLMNDETCEQVNNRSSSKYELRNRTKNTSYGPEFLEPSYKKVKSCSFEANICRNDVKGGKYECLTCNKTFESHRSLGGHRASHTKINGSNESIYESGENSIETNISPIHTPESEPLESCNGKKVTKPNLSDTAKRKFRSKKTKKYKCPICFKVYRSGQALGGHKRSHFVGGYEEKSRVIKQEASGITGLIDLNLPAPVEEEENGNASYMEW